MTKVSNSAIFQASETSGAISTSLTMSDGDSEIYSRALIYEDKKGFNGPATLYAKFGGSGSGTIDVKVSFYNGTDFQATEHTLQSGVSDDGEVEIYLNRQDFAIWKPHFGVKFKFDRASGTGDVPVTEGNYVVFETCS